jgi:hypothetical protein
MIGIGPALTLIFANVDGHPIAASRWNGRWGRFVGLTGGRHAALLRELNRADPLASGFCCAGRSAAH